MRNIILHRSVTPQRQNNSPMTNLSWRREKWNQQLHKAQGRGKIHDFKRAFVSTNVEAKRREKDYKLKITSTRTYQMYRSTTVSRLSVICYIKSGTTV